MEVQYHNEVSLTGRISGVSSTRLPNGYAVRFLLNTQRRVGHELVYQPVPCVWYGQPGRCYSVRSGAVVMISGRLTTENNGRIDVLAEALTELPSDTQLIPE